MMNLMETKKKKYLVPSQTVVEVDDSQLLLMASVVPGTTSPDGKGTSAARGNSMGWDAEDY